MGVRPKLLDKLRERIKAKHYSDVSKQRYVGRLRRNIGCHRRKHPGRLDGLGVEE